MKGGVFRNKSKQPGVTTTDLIMNIINDTTTKIHLIYLESLKGFLIKLEFDETVHNYFEVFNDEYTHITRTIDQIILKFGVITPDPYGERLRKLDLASGLVKKRADPESAFIIEATTQERIFETSVPVPICLAIIDLCFFNPANTLILVNKLSQLQIPLKKDYYNIHDMFNYLEDNVTGEFSLGMIVMEPGNNYITLVSMLNNPKYNANKDICIAIVIAQIIRMVYQSNIINCDCHSGNVFVLDHDNFAELISGTDRNKNIKSLCRLIDFGTPLSLKRGTSNGIQINVADRYEKITQGPIASDLHKLHDGSIKTLYPAKNSELSIERIEKLNEVIQIIFNIDLAYNFENFGNKYPQMRQIAFLLYEYDQPTWCTNLGEPLPSVDDRLGSIILDANIKKRLKLVSEFIKVLTDDSIYDEKLEEPVETFSTFSHSFSSDKSNLYYSFPGGLPVIPRIRQTRNAQAPPLLSRAFTRMRGFLGFGHKRKRNKTKKNKKKKKRR